MLAVAALVATVLSTPPGSSSVAPASEFTGAQEASLIATTLDLDTLGGRYSSATAVDGTVVAGYWRTTSDEFRAFAYDLAAPEPEMHDLGTLGGDSSYAVAVAGSVVVGTSSTAAGDQHAFAYDLAAAEPEMLDLGTLGGSSSLATAVDGTVVVGGASTAAGVNHAFAYDLAASEPVMQDLGSLGEGGSTATALDGTIVAGYSLGATGAPTEPYKRRAFAYDLAATDPEMVDLGTLGGSESFAKAVDRGVVVGRSDTTANPEHAFAYDFAGPQPAMQDLGTFDGDQYSQAVAMDGTIVVGESSPAGRYYPRAFAYDFAAPEPAMQDFDTLGDAKTWATAIAGNVVVGRWRLLKQTAGHAFAHDLGTNNPRTLGLGTWRGSEALAVDGDVVVGWATYASGSHATAWILRETTRPMIAFGRLDQQVKESAGRVTVEVIRYGDTDRAVTVRYRTRGQTAEAGQDFEATSGKLRFAPGTTSRSFTVRVTNDNRRERKKEFLLMTLSRPGSPALLGSPKWSQLRIRDNDR